MLFSPPSSFVDIETSCLEEKNKRDHFTQLVLACLVSYTWEVFWKKCMTEFDKGNKSDEAWFYSPEKTVRVFSKCPNNFKILSKVLW